MLVNAGSFNACNFQGLTPCMKISRTCIHVWRWLLLSVNFIGFGGGVLDIAILLLAARSSYVRTVYHYMRIHRCILLALTSLRTISLQVLFV